MGLAKFGIVNGAKVPIDGIEGVPQLRSSLNGFSSLMLRRSGFLGIAQKIVNKERLSIRDLSILIAEAGPAELMKLLSLAPRERKTLNAVPAVLLPIQYWKGYGVSTAEITDRAIEFVRGVPHRTIQVTFDNLSYKYLVEQGQQMIRQIAACRPGLVLVGPTIDDLIKELEQDGGVADEGALNAALATFRTAGFARLRASSNRCFLRLTKRHKFINCVITSIDRFEDESRLAEDLFQLSEITKRSQLIDSWGPAAEAIRESSWSDQAAMDIQLLRVLAIGSLALPEVPIIRASSKHFSLESLSFAFYFGATDLGFGAFDQMTRDILKLQRLESIASLPPA